MKEIIQQVLPAFLEEVFPAWREISIKEVENLTAGWESDIYAFNLSYLHDDKIEQQDFILRIYASEYASDKARHEFTGMQLLYEAGYPVPNVFHIETQPSQLGDAFMLMERIQGDVMWSMIEASSPQRQGELIKQFCRLMVDLHKLEWQQFTESPKQLENEGIYVFIDRWIEEARRNIREYNQEDFLPVVEWLTHHRDDMGAEKPSVIHNDFHPANVLVTPQGSAIVIDWTGWQVTDYRFDLAWSLLLAHAYAGEDLYRAILSGYQDAAGAGIDNITYFEVAACVRRLFDVLISLSLGAEERGMRPEAVEVMRSQIGNLAVVYNMLNESTRLRIPQIENLLLQHNTGTS